MRLKTYANHAAANAKFGAILKHCGAHAFFVVKRPIRGIHVFQIDVRVAYFQQSPGAHLLFQLREHRLSVFIFQDRPELSRLDLGSSIRWKLAFNYETWAEGGLRYFVVGDANRTDIHELSELIKRAARS